MRSRGDVELVDVELVDDEPPGDDAAPSAPALRRPRWLRRPPPTPARVWPATARVAAAVLVAGVATTGVSGAAEVARLRGVEGLSGSLAVPLVEAWSVSSGGPVAVVDGLVLTYGTAGPFTVAALDLATGTVVWTGPALPPGAAGWCQPASEQVTPGGSGILPTLAGPDVVVVCTAVTGDLEPRSPDGGATTIQVLDATTGEVRRSITLAATVWTVDVVAGDVVVYALGGDGRVVVSRWSSATGAAAWEWTSPPGMAPAGYLSLLEHGDGVAVLEGVDGTRLSLDLATGAEVPTTDDVGAGWDRAPALLPDGSVVDVQNPTGMYPTVVVTDADGSERFRTEGTYPLLPSVDDGSAAGVLVVADVRSGGVRALDLATGADLWKGSGLTWGGGAAVLGGSLVLSSPGSGVQVLAAGDGTTLWRSQAPAQGSGWLGSSVVTDGRRVLTVESHPGSTSGAASVLAARDLATGRLVWRGDAGSGAGWVTGLPDGSVLTMDGGELARLVPGRR